MKVEQLIEQLQHVARTKPGSEVLAHFEDMQEYAVEFIAEMQGDFVSLQLAAIPFGPPKS